MGKPVHAEIVLRGVVQGVGFRWFAVRKAREMGIKGFVKNQGWDEVFCVAEGEEGLVNDFIEQLRIGPRLSHVTSVVVQKSDKLVGYRSFEIELD
jgi:acylphosphatase